MAGDDDQVNNQGDPGSSVGGSSPTDAEKEDRASKMNAAKAFYRAMYAGEDVVPDDFGLVDKQKPVEKHSGPVSSGPCQNCARLEGQVAEANSAKAEAESHYKRMAADFENYRKRVDREREEFQGLGIQKAVETILPALDDMDRAKSSLGTVADPKAILESLNLVFARFTKCMDALGVKQLDVIGQPFDPRNHEPVQEIETNEFPDGVVVHELRRGYSFKDKILRPTLVNVSSNPSGVVVPRVAPPAVATPEEATEPAPAPANQSTTAAPEAPAVEPAVTQPEAPAAAVAAPEPATQSESQAKEPEDSPNVDLTATGDLPVFVDEQLGSDSLTQPLPDAADLDEPKKKKLDASIFDLSDVSEHE